MASFADFLNEDDDDEDPLAAPVSKSVPKLALSTPSPGQVRPPPGKAAAALKTAPSTAGSGVGEDDGHKKSKREKKSKKHKKAAEEDIAESNGPWSPGGGARDLFDDGLDGGPMVTAPDLGFSDGGGFSPMLGKQSGSSKKRPSSASGHSTNVGPGLSGMPKAAGPPSPSPGSPLLPTSERRGITDVGPGLSSLRGSTGEAGSRKQSALGGGRSPGASLSPVHSRRGSASQVGGFAPLEAGGSIRPGARSRDVSPAPRGQHLGEGRSLSPQLRGGAVRDGLDAGSSVLLEGATQKASKKAKKEKKEKKEKASKVIFDDDVAVAAPPPASWSSPSNYLGQSGSSESQPSTVESASLAEIKKKKDKSSKAKKNTKHRVDEEDDGLEVAEKGSRTKEKAKARSDVQGPSLAEVQAGTTLEASRGTKGEKPKKVAVSRGQAKSPTLRVSRFMLRFSPPTLSVLCSTGEGQQTVKAVQLQKSDLDSKSQSSLQAAVKKVCLELPFLTSAHIPQVEALLRRLASRQLPVYRVVSQQGARVASSPPSSSSTAASSKERVPQGSLVKACEWLRRGKTSWIRMAQGGGWTEAAPGVLERCDDKVQISAPSVSRVKSDESLEELS